MSVFIYRIQPIDIISLVTIYYYILQYWNSVTKSMNI